MAALEKHTNLWVSASLKWSVFAGVYAFVLGFGLFRIPLRVVSDVIIKLLPVIPNALPAVTFALPLSILGAIFWWAVIERRDAYSYVWSLAFGLLTTLSTLAFWTLVYAAFWGPELVAASAIIVGVVLVVAAPTAILGGPSLMFLRRLIGAKTATDADSGR